VKARDNYVVCAADGERSALELVPCEKCAIPFAPSKERHLASIDAMTGASKYICERCTSAMWRSGALEYEPTVDPESEILN
jgi:hypothetical protein